MEQKVDYKLKFNEFFNEIIEWMSGMLDNKIRNFSSINIPISDEIIFFFNARIFMESVNILTHRNDKYVLY